MRVIDLQRVCSVVEKIAFPFLPEILEKETQSPPSLEQIHNPLASWGDEYLIFPGESFVEVTQFWSFTSDRCTWPPLSKGPGHFERHFDRSSAGWTQVVFVILSEFVRKKSSEDWSCSIQEGDVLGLLASNWVVSQAGTLVARSFVNLRVPTFLRPPKFLKFFTSFKTCFYNFWIC